VWVKPLALQRRAVLCRGGGVNCHAAFNGVTAQTPSCELFGTRVDSRTLKRDVLEVTAFEKPREFGEHFKARYGPTIAAQANVRLTGREAELDAALNEFCDEWNRGSADSARFEMEYLLAVGTRA
jgi:hypothetical protein